MIIASKFDSFWFFYSITEMEVCVDFDISVSIIVHMNLYLGCIWLIFELFINLKRRNKEE